MKTSENGIKLIEQFEGCSLKSYQDVAGVWTNGYGNTHGVVPGTTITQAQAESDLLSNVAGSEYVVNTVVKVTLTQNQFDALVDFVFNLGSGNFQSSTLLRLLNQGDFAGASNEFPKWNHAGGVVVAGLTRRRLAEQALFNSTTVLTTPGPVSIPTEVTGAEQTIVSGIQGVTSFFTDLENKLGD